MQMIAHRSKKMFPVIAWDWIGMDGSAESLEIQVLGIVSAGQPVEAILDRQTISIPAPPTCQSGRQAHHPAQPRDPNSRGGLRRHSKLPVSLKKRMMRFVL